MLHRTSVALISCLFLGASPLFADDELETLIDELTQVSEPGVGYAGSFSGSNFLPYEDAEQLGTLVIGATRRSDSDTLRKIIEKGAEAVPTLLKHLSDGRKTGLEPLEAQGRTWMDFPDEYDYNSRTRSKPPEGVNRDTFGSDKGRPTSHAVTVGDLCFVALGQIVNRDFNATRYQPTAGIIVNSPTYSPRLRVVVRADWGNLTAEKHKRLLIDDFEKPDFEDRRIGAYRRLCFYYPDAVESLVLKVLEQPTFDVEKIWEFCRETLYHAKPEERKQLYDEFLRNNGNQYSAGVMEQLFDDLHMLEAQEAGGLSPPLTAYSTQPRELLIQLFHKPATVKSTDRPAESLASDSKRARFIGSLTHDDSKRIGEVVKQVFLEHSEDDYLAPACLKCLASRGFGEFLVEQLDKIDYSAKKLNYLHSQYLEAIATSKSPQVQKRLLQVIQETTNAEYFFEALAGIGDAGDELILKQATRVLNALPDDTNEGGRVLELIGNRYPEQAEDVFQAFLSKGSVQRAETMCSVLWDGHPLSPRVLAPLLDDERKLSGFTVPMRVCDRAAQAISHTTDQIEFDSDWPEQRKDAAILKLKEYCAKQR